MRLVLTGGGTGGHVYPALEVGRIALLRGAELTYLGSNRGRERSAALDRGIPFVGFPSEPLYSIRTLRGLKAVLKLQQSRRMARNTLKGMGAEVVFSTGGYSGGPVVAAAQDLGLPYILHSIDSSPARSLAMFAKNSTGFTYVFKSTPSFLKLPHLERTGQPIRPELRSQAPIAPSETPNVLILGGSQGSTFLNELTLQVAQNHPSHLFRLVAGEKNVTELLKREIPLNVEICSYLSGPDMGQSLSQAQLVIGRSGGSLAEWAVFGVPSILVPLPNSANGHQLHNAREFAAMGASSLIEQPDATSERVSESIDRWLSSFDERSTAFESLKSWDVPDATDRIVDKIFKSIG